MTVSYTGDVGNASSFGCFNKILLRWRGSVYKLIYKELLAYISLYLVINLTYRLVSQPTIFPSFFFRCENKTLQIFVAGLGEAQRVRRETGLLSEMEGVQGDI